MLLEFFLKKKDHDYIFVYVNDILIVFDDIETHLKHLDIFNTICKNHELVLSKKKAKLMQEK